MGLKFTRLILLVWLLMASDGSAEHLRKEVSWTFLVIVLVFAGCQHDLEPGSAGQGFSGTTRGTDGSDATVFSI